MPTRHSGPRTPKHSLSGRAVEMPFVNLTMLRGYKGADRAWARCGTCDRRLERLIFMIGCHLLRQMSNHLNDMIFGLFDSADNEVVPKGLKERQVWQSRVRELPSPAAA